MALNPIAAYTRWLHTQWPAGTTEQMPDVQEDGRTGVPGVVVVGDLTGVPLLKFSADTGTKAVAMLAEEDSFDHRDTSDESVVDFVIVGGGTSGFAAAKECEKRGLSYTLIEAAQPFSTIVNFPKGKPIYTYPTEMTPAGDLQFNDKSDVKEGLLEDLREQTIDQGIEVLDAKVDHIARDGKLLRAVIQDGDDVRAHRVIVGIGRSGNYRKLGVPGEELNKVSNRLHDPAEFGGQDILVVGGGDSAMETAIALAEHDAKVTLSYRKAEFNRPKPENVERLKELADGGDGAGSVTLMMASNVKEIREDEVVVKDENGDEQTLPNDNVFAMIGREPPLDFFRKSDVRVRGDKDARWWVTLAVMMAFCFWIYHWKSGKAFFGIKALPLPEWLNWNPRTTLETFFRWIGDPVLAYFGNESTLGGVIVNAMSDRAFYYTAAYAACVVIFGVRRIKRRRTPYVMYQTLTLMAIQVVPLFLLPTIILPYLHVKGAFDGGVGQWIANTFFPDQSWWRAYGLILAWPLMAWNWFTSEPIWGWLILGFLQTFVAIPAMIYFWGKGAYCGWICSCGALAETLGDTHRRKMPHGIWWNRLNMLGQVFLAFAVILMGMRIYSWIWTDGAVASWYHYLLSALPFFSYEYMVDLLWAGILGVGLYFHFSGRVWCRFACPLAALMHIYARFSRFGIVADKKKCISCNECTSVCHQGIDIMSFANKGKPMIDPECVRCSACVQTCPTGVLSFGQVDGSGATIKTDPAWLAASPVRMAEATQVTVNGKNV